MYIIRYNLKTSKNNGIFVTFYLQWFLLTVFSTEWQRHKIIAQTDQ